MHKEKWPLLRILSFSTFILALSFTTTVHTIAFHTHNTMEFSSEGFDLDALENQQQDDVVYEIGGGVSRLGVHDDEYEAQLPNSNDSTKNTPPDVLAEAQEFKAQGNAAFQQQNWMEAIDMYTAAMDATPGMKGSELLQLRQEWRDQERLRARAALQKQEEERRQKKKNASNEEQTEEDNTNDNSTTTTTTTSDDAPSTSFQPPPHEHGETVAIFYCNRAAAYIQLERYQDAVQDCDVAILWHPTYTKAYVRRSKAYEHLEQYEMALTDIEQALALEKNSPSSSSKARAQYLATKRRLEKLEAERMEKLKEETMGKLKDLGNSILGNFGLSLDNFKAVQDPQTGSYSISFDQNNNK